MKRPRKLDKKLSGACHQDYVILIYHFVSTAILLSEIYHLESIIALYSFV